MATEPIEATPNIPIEHFVSLDLGSETMAAYWQPVAGAGRIIDLQAHADTLVRGKATRYSDRPNGSASERKSSRVMVRDNQPTPDLPDEHARLNLIELNGHGFTRGSGADDTVFIHFFPEGASPLGDKTIPNPKIAFQFNAISVFPQPMTVDRIPYELDPATIVEHLTTQVIRNFVLRSPQLHLINPKSIHLVLTVPNVYSVEHAEALREFVTANTEVGLVSVISESDALAYYYFFDMATPDIVKRERRAERDGATGRQVLTLDVGRGTTDLSLVEIVPPGTNGNRRPTYAVLARTGRASGGNYLSYLFADFYEKQVEQAFAPLLRRLGIDHRPISLLTVPEGEAPSVDQLAAVSALENYIDVIKRSVTHDFKVILSEADRLLADDLIDQIVDRLVRATKAVANIDERPPTTPPPPPPGAIPGTGGEPTLALPRFLQGPQPDNQPGPTTFAPPPPPPGWEPSAIQDLRRALFEAFWPPVNLPTPKPLLRFLKPQDARQGDLVELRKSIDEYIRRNVDELLDELGMMVASQELRDTDYAESKKGARQELFRQDRTTVVVVGGQAAQFEPVKERIRSLCSPYVTQNMLHQLTGVQAKLACATGAVRFKSTGHDVQDSSALFGTYGILSTAPNAHSVIEDTFQPISSEALRSGEPVVVRFGFEENRCVVYTPRVLLPEEVPYPQDEMTSVLKNLNTLQSEYVVTFDPQKRKLIVGGVEVSPANFGNVQEDIWPKVWPERLRPVNR